METEAFIQKCKKIFLENHEYDKGIYDKVFNTFCFEAICQKLGITLEHLKERFECDDPSLIQEGDNRVGFLFAKEIGIMISTLPVN